MGASSTMSPPLLRNLIASIFTILDKSLRTLSSHSNFLKFISRVLTSFFLYFISSFIGNPNDSPNTPAHYVKNHKGDTFSVSGSSDSGLARALSQLLTIVNDLPVSSRKYEIVRSLAERIVDDNNREGIESLCEVNRKALTTSFTRTIRRLENAAVAEERGDLGLGLLQSDFYYLGRVLKVLRYFGDVAWARVVNLKPVAAEEVVAAPGGGLGEKLAAEVLWLGQKLAACGYVEEAVEKWASASSLAWLSLRAEPRLQGALVKVSAFLFKQAGEIGRDGEAMDEERKMKQKVMKMKMLVTWLPLLCRASNGVDAPVLSALERGELERILEEMIDELDGMEDREQVLSLWLHHFTYCPSSDWPNLRECYARWCIESRKLMLVQ